MKFIGAVEDDRKEKMLELDLAFQVGDVKKPLLAVRRMGENGNVVQFGPEADGNFIQNVKSGQRGP